MRAALRCLTMVLACCASSAQAFDGIRVTLLGTRVSQLASESFGPGILVEAGDYVLLFDSGRGVVQRLQQAGMPLTDIDAVFLTHPHPDHSVAIQELWRSALAQGRREALVVFGPRGTSESLRAIDHGDGVQHPQSDVLDEAPAIDGRDIEENVLYRTEQVTVTAFVVDHGPVKPAYGFRVDYQGRRTVVLSGATRYSENLVRNARGVQLLVHEVAAANAQAAERSQEIREALAVHSSPEDAARVFRSSRPYLAVLSHILAFDVTDDEILRRTRASYRGAVELGRDLMVIEIQGELQIRNAPSEPHRPRD